MIHHGDLFAVLPTLAEASIDAGVTDPPYGIGFMAKQWDTFNPEKARASKMHAITVGPKGNHANPNVRGRRQSPAMSPSQIEYNRSLEGQRGFQEWTERWAREVYRVLKPGAYLVVCGAPRSHHRMMCGLEDAGFVVRDCFAWLTGQGFPKNYNLGEGKGTALKPGHEGIAIARKPVDADAERSIIVANLLRLEAQLWSLLPASIAVERFKLSRAEHDAACASVQWSADERSSMWADLFGAMDTSRCVSVMRTSLSIVSSWNAILAESSGLTSTFIIGTRSSTTIDWTILKSCSSALTPRGIIQAEISAPGSRFGALRAARYLNAALMNLGSILELSALGPAIASGQERCPVEAALESKIAHEPIALAWKPFKGSIKACHAQHGTAALNIEACRVGDEPVVSLKGLGDHRNMNDDGWKGIGHRPEPTTNLGRWPANVLLDAAAAAQLDTQTGELTSGLVKADSKRQGLGYSGQAHGNTLASDTYGDSGGASRFYYVAKPSREERDYGCEALALKSGGEGSGRVDGTAGIGPRSGAQGSARNIHPTVKPVELMRWLVKLVTPLHGTVLDPFTGSGTTGMACRYEQRGFVGVEREAEYVAIAERRIAAVAPLFGDEVA